MKNNILLLVVKSLLVMVFMAGYLQANQEQVITVAMIEEAQENWGDGLVLISTTHREGGDAKAAAETMLQTLYFYPEGKVLFKPTLTSGDTVFRPTYEGALSYFVGGNPRFPSDRGFALSPFVGHRSEIDSLIIKGNVAIVMGNVWLKTPDGDEIKVDKTFAYTLDDNGNLRIITHHSSLPVKEDN